MEATIWDVVVIGTGMGGATLGYALAKAGLRVLFLEKGLDLRAGNREALRGRFVEDSPGLRQLRGMELRRELLRGGRAADQIDDGSSLTPYIGCGTGGSSALYGAVLERFFPADFTPGANYSPGHASTLPDQWPIRYEDLSPWYDIAERLYRVRGTADPMRPTGGDSTLLAPPPLSPANEWLFERLQQQGEHPYRAHVACERVAGCTTCQGYLCSSGCKNDAASICLEPAVEQFGAQLLTGCAALQLEADRTLVRRVVCRWKGRRLTLRARYFVVAAGALLTPALLLNSKSAEWPGGLANTSGLVGRNLMRHLIDLYVLTKAPALAEDEPAKEIALNDFYLHSSGKLGCVQSFGLAPPLGLLQGAPGFNLWRLLGPAAPWIWKRHARLHILASILEDLPYLENRVRLQGSAGGAGSPALSLNYSLGPSERTRRKRFRQLMAKCLKPFGAVRTGKSPSRAGLGHVCGTCRFGTDPRSSVLDPSNRAHGVENLYVVDASFFPSSGGINPALTVAANALRVAHLMAAG